MKKILFLILALILVACSPQMTAAPEATATPTPLPTETPIPTPTLNPDFVAVQNFISGLNENLVLLPDGTIEELTADGGRQTIPNLHVDQNGTINILFNNEQVVIETSQIAFDAETGLTIEGYELNDVGEWEEVKLTAEDYFEEDRTVLGLEKGVDYEERINEDGVIERWGLEGEFKGKLLYRDGAGWNSRVVLDLIEHAGVCKPTDFPPSSNLPQEATDYLWDLFKSVRTTDEFKLVNIKPLYDELGIYNYNSFAFPFGGKKNCWAAFTQPINPKKPFTYVSFETVDDKVVGMPVFTP